MNNKTPQEIVKIKHQILDAECRVSVWKERLADAESKLAELNKQLNE